MCVVIRVGNGAIIAHDPVTCGTCGHDINASRFGKGEVSSHECVLEFWRGLLDDVATIARRFWNLNELNAQCFAKGLNAIFDFGRSSACCVSWVVCNFHSHKNTSEPLVNLVEQAHDFVVGLNLTVDHVWNLSDTSRWCNQCLEAANWWSTSASESKEHSC